MNWKTIEQIAKSNATVLDEQMMDQFYYALRESGIALRLDTDLMQSLVEHINRRLAPSVGKKALLQWYYSLTQLKDTTGRDVSSVRAFIAENSVPDYHIGVNASYFLPEFLEAVDKTRWASRRGKRGA